MRRHGFGSRRSKCHIDVALRHQAEDGLQVFVDIGVAQLRQRVRIFSGELRLAEAFHLGMFGKADKMLV